jgi:hypothetical protein
VCKLNPVAAFLFWTLSFCFPVKETLRECVLILKLDDKHCCMLHWMFLFCTQTNVQLLATCYLHNNQPYAAYHILKGNNIFSPFYYPILSRSVIKLYENRNIQSIPSISCTCPCPILTGVDFFFCLLCDSTVGDLLILFWCAMKGRSCQSLDTCLLYRAFGWTSCEKQKKLYVQSMNQIWRYTSSSWKCPHPPRSKKKTME